MRSFVHILIYLMVLGCQLVLVLISIHVQLLCKTVRLFTSLRVQRKDGLKAEPPRALLNESIHTPAEGPASFLQLISLVHVIYQRFTLKSSQPLKWPS